MRVSLDPFGQAGVPAAARGGRRHAITALLLLLLLLALFFRQMLAYHLDSGRGLIFTHLGGMLEYFARFDQGEFWGRRPGLGGIDLRMDGSLYYWLHLPIRLFVNPFRGLLVLDFVLEGGALVFWVLWGLVKRLPPSLVWLSAFFLVVVGNPNGELLENSQTANLLTVPLMMAMIGAIVTPKARAMLLPGVLLGLIFQIHQAYLILAIPLVVLTLSCGQRRWRRLLFLVLGAVGAYLLALPAIELPGHKLVGDSSSLASQFDLEVLKRVVDTHHPALLAWLGLALVVGRRLWRGEVGPAGRVAAVWLLSGWPLMVLAVCLAAPKLANPGTPVRFGFLGPAEAILYAVVLLLGGGLCQRILRRPGTTGLRQLATPVACLLVLLLTGVSVAFGLASTGSPLRAAIDRGFPAMWGDRLPDADQRRERCCQPMFRCGTPSLSRTYVRLADAMLQTKWGAELEPRFKFHGPADYYLDGIQMMLDTSLWRSDPEGHGFGAASEGQGLYRHVLALPCSMKEQLPQIPGECDRDGLLFVPDVKNVSMEGDPNTGVSGFRVSPAPGARRLFALTSRSRPFVASAVPTRTKERSLQGEGVKITRLARCFCGTDFTFKVSILELQNVPGRWTLLVESGAKTTMTHHPGGARAPRKPGSSLAPYRRLPPPSIPLSERMDLVEIPLRTTGGERPDVPRTRGYRHATPRLQPIKPCPSSPGAKR